VPQFPQRFPFVTVSFVREVGRICLGSDE